MNGMGTASVAGCGSYGRQVLTNQTGLQLVCFWIPWKHYTSVEQTYP